MALTTSSPVPIVLSVTQQANRWEVTGIAFAVDATEAVTITIQVQAVYVDPVSGARSQPVLLAPVVLTGAAAQQLATAAALCALEAFGLPSSLDGVVLAQGFVAGLLAAVYASEQAAGTIPASATPAPVTQPASAFWPSAPTADQAAIAAINAKLGLT